MPVRATSQPATPASEPWEEAEQGVDEAAADDGSARGAAGRAREQAREVAGQAGDQARQVTDQARDKAQQAGEQAKGRLRQEVETRSSWAGMQLQSTSRDLGAFAQELRNQGNDMPAKVADEAAQRTEQVAAYLANADADRLLRDLEDFGRRQPLAVVGGGLALGFGASRFLKASGSRSSGSSGAASARGRTSRKSTRRRPA